MRGEVKWVRGSGRPLGKEDKTSNISRINQLKMLSLRKLASTYCISGELHSIDPTTNICSKCNINVVSHKYTIEELTKLGKKLKHNSDITIFDQLNNIKKYFKFNNFVWCEWLVTI